MRGDFSAATVDVAVVVRRSVLSTSLYLISILRRWLVIRRNGYTLNSTVCPPAFALHVAELSRFDAALSTRHVCSQISICSRVISPSFLISDFCVDFERFRSACFGTHLIVQPLVCLCHFMCCCIKCTRFGAQANLKCLLCEFPTYVGVSHFCGN